MLFRSVVYLIVSIPGLPYLFDRQEVQKEIESFRSSGNAIFTKKRYVH